MSGFNVLELTGGLCLFLFGMNLMGQALAVTGLLEKISVALVPDAKMKEKTEELDERLLGTPPVALGRSKDMVLEMGRMSIAALKSSPDILYALLKRLTMSLLSMKV